MREAPVDGRASALDWLALVVALIAAVAALVGALGAPAAFFGAYLTAFAYWMSVSLGCLALGLLFWLAGGRWGVATERFFEAGAATLPMMVVLFVPLIAGLWILYPWTNLQTVAADPMLLHKQAYLNVPFYLIRTGFYFVVWLALAWALLRWSRRRDQAADAEAALGLARRLQGLAAAGIIVMALTATFAAVDWLMSLQPDWYSTVFGAMLSMGGVLGAFGLGTALAALGAGREPLKTVVTPRVLNDLGNLLLAFVMLWAYLEFSQYLIIWFGDEPTEALWYVQRTVGNWQWLALAVVATQFALPLALLIVREVKRSAPFLAALAGFILFTRYLDFYWVVKPALGQGFSWLDPTLALGMGALWLFVFRWRRRHAPALPRAWPAPQPAPEGSRATA